MRPLPCRLPVQALAALITLVVALAPSWATGAPAERSLPIDCLPDRVVAWQPAGPAPDGLFGAALLPGIILGPPGASTPSTGSLTVASLGVGGSVTLTFTDIIIENGPGPDFIIFENAFFVGATPTSTDVFGVFVEPAFVEVSMDGIVWFTFPFEAQALEDSRGIVADWHLFVRLQGLAGVTPTFTGNWTVPDDAATWDAGGSGGVSGAGGDAFDLAAVGLDEARFIRITDAATGNGNPGSAAGFDLDAVVVLHGRPVPPTTADQDADLLSDGNEQDLYASMVAVADTDLDGTGDGREVAGCHDPAATDVAPWWRVEPRLTLRESGDCIDLRWTFLGSGSLVDVIRGALGNVLASALDIDLGPTTCLGAQRTGVNGICDAEPPAAGETFFYLARESSAAAYGRASSLAPRSTLTGCP